MDKLTSLTSIIKQNSNWLEILKEKPYCLKIKEHPEHPMRWMFSYNMIDSDMSLDAVQVSRGLILDIVECHVFDKTKNYSKDQIEVVREVTPYCYAFDKFFNWNESNAAKLDWFHPVMAPDKMDGSLIKLRSRENKPNWMTNNGFDANAYLPGDLVCGAYRTFQDLIDEAYRKWSLNTQKKIIKLAEEYTLMFELTSKYNVICVHYETDAELFLIGARHMKTFKEVNLVEFLYETGLNVMQEVKIPPRHIFSNLDHALNYVKDLNPNFEGLVLCDEHFNRVKVKSDWYVSVHRLKDDNGQLSSKHLLESIQNGTIDDIIGYFPEYELKIREIEGNYQDLSEYLRVLCKTAKTNYVTREEQWGNDPKEQKKQFAMKFKDHKFSSVCFDVWKSPEDLDCIKERYLMSMDYEKFEKSVEAMKLVLTSF